MSSLNFCISIFKININKSLFVKLFIGAVIFIFGLSFFLNKVNLGVSENEIIRAYQMSKVNNRKFEGIRNIIIGDSSGGNAISSRYFKKLSGERTANLSLNGSWGIAGSLGMLKNAYEKNPNIKNVVIMQTLDIWRRGYPYEAIFKLYSFNEIINEVGLYKFIIYSFNPKVIWWNTKNILKNLIGFKTVIQITADYVMQDEEKFSNDKKILNNSLTLNGVSINEDKLKEIEDLQNFCVEKNLNCTFTHGPMHEKVTSNSQEYIAEVNRVLKERLKINFVENVFSYKNGMMGDSLDHVDFNHKEKVTEDYYNQLKPYLK